MSQVMNEPPLGPSAPGGGITQQPQTLPLELSSRSSGRSRGEDYVYVDRTTAGFSSDAIAHSTAAKLKLESYYKVAVDAAIERNARCDVDFHFAPVFILTFHFQTHRT
jgi:protein-serine/threonine kinase